MPPGEVRDLVVSGSCSHLPANTRRHGGTARPAAADAGGTVSALASLIPVTCTGTPHVAHLLLPQFLIVNGVH